MRVQRHLSVLTVLCALVSVPLLAQPIVSENPQNRTVLLEEFTGIHCGFCPDGHAIAADIQDAHPEDVVLINVHAGSYANPRNGEPDFRTQWGDALASWSGLSGYPAGMVNRHVFSGQSVRGVGRNLWTTFAEEILTMPSPCNVGLRSEFNADKREVTITTMVYYTGNTSPQENRLNVVITENGVVGYQSGDAQGSQGNYTHNHIMRAMVTGQWGQTITHEGPGTLVENEFTYTLPEEWVAENCDVVAFVAQGQAEVYTAAHVHLNGGSTAVIADAKVEGESNVLVEDASASTVSITGLMPGTSTYRLSIDGTLPETWSAEMSTNGQTSSSELIVEIEEGTTIDVDLNIIPQTPGFAELTLVCTSVDLPGASAQTVTISALRPAAELLINHFDADAFVSTYETALSKAGAESVVVLSNEQLSKFLNDQTLMTEVKDIYYNVSWSFPAMTDVLAGWLKRQMDAGSNLFIAGQDIGWDLMSGHENSHGTQLQAEFFTDYLHAEFLGDGDNTTMTGTFTDAVLGFDELGSVILRDPYGGNMYPEQLATTEFSKAIFTYNANDVAGGVYAQHGNYKVVYLGIGLEQFANPTTGEEVIQITRDWFTGVISDVDFSEELNNLFHSSVYPNPATDEIRIDLRDNTTGEYELIVLDVEGRTAQKAQVQLQQGVGTISVESLAAGTYSWMITGNEKRLAGGKFVKQ